MGIRFNIDEVLEMACEIERNGVVFYSQAQDCFDDQDAKKFLADLAAMEVEHEKTFKAMKAALTETDKQPLAYDPEGLISLYLQSLADDHVFDLKHDTCALTSATTPAEILKSAIKKERDSIVFFVGLKELVPERFGRGKIDNIIREEINHVAVIKKELARVCAAEAS